jgi:hypothetical protein
MAGGAHRVGLLCLISCLISGGLVCGGIESRGPRARGPSSFSAPVPALSDRDRPPPEASPPATPAHVVRGDVWRPMGSLLLVLNRYRGLLVIDLAGDHPRLVGRVPAAGQPMALLLEGTRAFALVGDTAACLGCPLDPRRPQQSELLVVDLSAPRAPRLTSRVPLAGTALAAQLRGTRLDVVTRGVGAFTAAAGNVVTVFDTSPADGPRVVGRLELPGPAWIDQLLFAGDALYLALYGWHGWTGTACTAWPRGDIPIEQAPEGCSKLVAVDLREAKPSPAIDVRGRISPGDLHHHDGVLRVLTHVWPRADTSDAPSLLLTTLRTSAAELRPAGALALPVLGPGSDAPVLRHDGARAYLEFPHTTEPLLILDLAVPEAPALAGDIPDVGLRRMILQARPGRLLTREITPPGDDCVSSQLALYDVTDARRPAVIARLPLPADNALDPTLLGDANLIAVSYFGQRTRPLGHPTRGLQLFDVDMAAGTLRARGRTADGLSWNSELVQLGERLLSLSDERLERVEVSDRDAPRLAGGIELAPWVQNLRFVNGGAVEVVVTPGGGRFYLHLVPADDLNSVHPLASLAFEGTPARLYANDRFLYHFWVATRDGPYSEPRLDVFEVADGRLLPRSSRSLEGPATVDLGWSFDGDGGHGDGVRQVGPHTFLVPVFRVTDCRPPEPEVVPDPGSPGTRTCHPPLPLLPPLAPSPPRIAEEPAVAGQRRMLGGGCPGAEADFLVVDAANPEAPTVASLARIPGEAPLGNALLSGLSWPSIETVLQGTTVLFTKVESTGRPAAKDGSMRYHALEMDLARPEAPQLGALVNVPGKLLAVRRADNTWFTAEPLLDDQRRRRGLTISALYRPPGSGRAYLERRLELDGVSDPVVEGSTLVVTANDALVVVDLGQPESPVRVATVPVLGATAVLRPQLVAGHAFLTVGDYTLRAFDVRGPAAPRVLPETILAPWPGALLRLAPGNQAAVPLGGWGVALLQLAPAP